MGYINARKLFFLLSTVGYLNILPTKKLSRTIKLFVQGNIWSLRKHFKPNLLHMHTEHAKPRKMLELDFSFSSQVVAAFVSQDIAIEKLSACSQ